MPDYRDLGQFKELIKPFSDKMNREQILQLQREMFELADILLNHFIYQRKKEISCNIYRL